MGRVTLARLRSDAGMTTAEYAVGTVAACGFGGVLIKLLSSDTVVQLLLDVIKHAFSFLF
ncbi:MAG: DUF4244 domain-containing protein [Actinomycetes bacterium]